MNEPSDDNPRHEFDDENKRVRLYCTDCDPECLITDRDVAYWNVMPHDLITRDAFTRAVEDHVEWLNHMLKVHKLRPSDEALDAMNETLTRLLGEGHILGVDET